MITEVIVKTKAKHSRYDWVDPHQYRYWADFIQRMKREGHLVLVDIEESNHQYRRTVRLWKDWNSYLIPFFDVGARPIIDLLDRYEHSIGILTETVVTET